MTPDARPAAVVTTKATRKPPADVERDNRTAAAQRLLSLDADALSASRAFGGLLRVQSDSRQVLDLLRAYQPNTVGALERLLAEVAEESPSRPLLHMVVKDRVEALGLPENLGKLVLSELNVGLRDEVRIDEQAELSSLREVLTIPNRAGFLSTFAAGSSLGDMTLSPLEVLRELKRDASKLPSSPVCRLSDASIRELFADLTGPWALLDVVRGDVPDSTQTNRTDGLETTAEGFGNSLSASIALQITGRAAELGLLDLQPVDFSQLEAALQDCLPMTPEKVVGLARIARSAAVDPALIKVPLSSAQHYTNRGKDGLYWVPITEMPQTASAWLSMMGEPLGPVDASLQQMQHWLTEDTGLKKPSSNRPGKEVNPRWLELSDASLTRLMSSPEASAWIEEIAKVESFSHPIVKRVIELGLYSPIEEHENLNVSLEDDATESLSLLFGCTTQGMATGRGNSSPRDSVPSHIVNQMQWQLELSMENPISGGVSSQHRTHVLGHESVTRFETALAEAEPEALSATDAALAHNFTPEHYDHGKLSEIYESYDGAPGFLDLMARRLDLDSGAKLYNALNRRRPRDHVAGWLRSLDVPDKFAQKPGFATSMMTLAERAGVPFSEIRFYETAPNRPSGKVKRTFLEHPEVQNYLASNAVDVVDKALAELLPKFDPAARKPTQRDAVKLTKLLIGPHHRRVCVAITDAIKTNRFAAFGKPFSASAWRDILSSVQFDHAPAAFALLSSALVAPLDDAGVETLTSFVNKDFENRWKQERDCDKALADSSNPTRGEDWFNRYWGALEMDLPEVQEGFVQAFHATASAVASTPVDKNGEIWSSDPSPRDLIAMRAEKPGSAEWFSSSKLSIDDKVEVFADRLLDSTDHQAPAELLEQMAALPLTFGGRVMAEVAKTDQALAPTVAELSASQDVDAPRVPVDGAVPEGWVRVLGSPDLLRVDNSDHKSPQLIPKDQEYFVLPSTEAPAQEVVQLLSAGAFAHIEGPPGVGKTALLRHIAQEINKPFFRISCTDKTDFDSMFGMYVGGKEIYSPDDVAKMSVAELRAALVDELAFQVAEIEPEIERLERKALGGDASQLSRGQVQAALAREPAKLAQAQKEIANTLRTLVDFAQKEPRWVDGPAARAIKENGLLCFDEWDLLPNATRVQLHSVFDSSGRVTLGNGEVLSIPEGFVAATTGNGTGVTDRLADGKATASRRATVKFPLWQVEDYLKFVERKFDDQLPREEVIRLVTVHELLAREALGKRGMSREIGKVYFTPRQIEDVMAEVIALQDASDAPVEEVAKRALQSVYLNRIKSTSERDIIAQGIDTQYAMVDTSDFYANLTVEVDAAGISVGDVRLNAFDTGHDRVPGAHKKLHMTPRLTGIIYETVKAWQLGQAMYLPGPHGTAKSAVGWFLAHVLGLPAYMQSFGDDTDLWDLVGSHGPNGYQPSELFRGAGHPSVIILDEINASPASTQEFFNPVFDGEGAFYLEDGERFDVHPNAHFLLTSNTLEAGYSAGLNPCSEAFLSRVRVNFVDEMDEAEQTLIIQLRAIDTAETLANTLGLSGDKAESFVHNFGAVMGQMVALQYDIRSGYAAGLAEKRGAEPEEPARSSLRLGLSADVFSDPTDDMSIRTLERCLLVFANKVSQRFAAEGDKVWEAAFAETVDVNYGARSPTTPYEQVMETGEKRQTTDRDAIARHAQALWLGEVER